MKVLQAPVFIFCCILFTAHQVLQKIVHQPVPIADDYLDNLLITPMLLTFLLVEKRILFRRGPDYNLTVLEISLATIVIALVCELLFPYLSDAFVTDWMDIIFYIAGSYLFYKTINYWPEKRNPVTH